MSSLRSWVAVGAVSAALGAVRPASAGEPEGRYRVDPEAKARFEAIERTRKDPPPRLGVREPAVPDGPLNTAGVIVRIDDGTVLFAVTVSPADARQLAEHVEVLKRVEDADDHTLFGNTLYLRFRIDPTGPSLASLTQRIGQPVKLELKRPPAGFPGIVFVRAP